MLRLTFLIALILVLATPFYATTLTQAIDQPNLEAALTNLQFINFDLTEGITHDYTSTGFNALGASFLDIAGDASDDLYLTNNALFAMGYGSVLATPFGQPDAHMQINFATAVTGIGFLARGWDPMTFSFSIEGSNVVEIAQIPGRTGSPVWIGVVSDTPFTTINITNKISRGFIDNFEFGAAVTVADPAPVGETPELATMLMIGFGLLALPACKRLNAFRTA